LTTLFFARPYRLAAAKKGNPLSEKLKGARYSQSRTDTLIGVGTRVEGNITFTGVLRTDGELIGDVSCGDDTRATVVVGKLGRVTGAVKAPHVVVAGRVDGPVHSSESIEIHSGACVTGGASYKDIVIHEGGVVQGPLTPSLSTDEGRSGQVHRVLSLESAAVKKSNESHPNAMADGNEIGERAPKVLKFGVAVALLVAVVVIVWMNLSPTSVKPPAADVVAKDNKPAAENPASETAPAPAPAPVASTTPLSSPAAVTASPIPIVPSSEPITKDVVVTTPPDGPELDLKNVTVVKGDDPGKPADFLYVVIGKEPAVLFRKQRKDPAEGTRITVASGTSKRIPIARDDILRVEQGRGIQMFYQGRKVAPATIESGAWISFVPNSRGGASGQ
jgi:cytoskeletal protein CcmA (bactofilin family)